MVVMRRYILRLLRLRNLITFTVILILLYAMKNLSTMHVEETQIVANIQDAQIRQPVRHERKLNHFVPASLKKKDWHNYTQINYEQQRVGIGEHGRPASLPKTDGALEQALYSVNGFNGALSDKIPLNRSLPDIRHPGCKKKLYIESLPTVSVVVPFHNEHWSTLLRTAFSVLYRSPEHLIKEIFLVDDASTKGFLGKELEDYLAVHMPKVHVVRVANRSGLITARLAGAKLATADVLVFLDSHTEANVNWLPPLLEPIALDYRTVVCPFIDVVAFDTFEYRAQDEGARGAFDWEFYYKRLPVLPKDEDNMPEPFASPVMAGGLFAISTSFFWELGGYDPGLDIWGGEQYELSFKIWQCGGRMVDAPCSRVGHIYRKFAPFPNPGHGDFVGKNYRRVAEVWMDEYAEFLYRRRPNYRNIDPGDLTPQKALRERLHCKPFRWFITQNYRRVAEVWMDEYAEFLYRRRPNYRNIDPGDLTPQKALRERLHCKPFRWFITQIAFDLPYKYPPVEPKPFGEGRIRPVENEKFCIDAHNGQQMEKLILTGCSNEHIVEQHFVLSWHKDIKTKKRNMCWDLPDSKPRSSILLYSCHLGGGNQLWKYDEKTKQIKAGVGENCVDAEYPSLLLFINRCDPASPTQKWLVDHVDSEMLAKWDTMHLRVTGPVEQY